MEEIEQLEIQIEQLREAIQRSRKIVAAGRACAVIGLALLAAAMIGVLNLIPLQTVVGIALALGGLVLTGSSKASTEQLKLSLKRTEEERNAAIDALELVELGGAANQLPV
jgi:hypothetical protein